MRWGGQETGAASQLNRPAAVLQGSNHEVNSKQLRSFRLLFLTIDGEPSAQGQLIIALSQASGFRFCH